MIAILFAFSTVCSAAQTFPTATLNTLVEQIETALKQGSSRELSKYLDQTVEIKLEDKRGDYSRRQAEIILHDFFKKHPSIDFDLIHQSESSEKIIYLLGNYQSIDGTFKTLIKSKAGPNGQPRIYSLEITRE